jgi:hypothetical protein
MNLSGSGSIRVRTFSGGYPLLGLDVTTDSQKVAKAEAYQRAQDHGYENVQVTFPGERPFRGRELRELIER